MGRTKEALKAFPRPVRIHIGWAMYQAQIGLKAPVAKPMSGYSGGVMEVVANFEGNAYRGVYAPKLADRIYVLHVFQKKSKAGIATPLPDLRLIERRYNEARELTARRMQ